MVLDHGHVVELDRPSTLISKQDGLLRAMVEAHGPVCVTSSFHNFVTTANATQPSHITYRLHLQANDELGDFAEICRSSGQCGIWSSTS
jgi:hypothetical protein